MEVVAVHKSPTHTMAKQAHDAIRLLAGHGVDGDAHAGATVKHRSRVARDPSQANLRQVHLLAAELHDELHERGFAVATGDMGENITTRGLDLLALPTRTRLRLGATAVVELQGLRNPCRQLDGVAAGLQSAVLARHADGSLARRAGVMATVVASGDVRPGDPIAVELPAGERRPLVPV